MNKKQLIVAWCRKFRFLCCVLLISLFVIPFLCLAEINKEALKELKDAMQGLTDAWLDNYKEMSKYCKPYYTYDKSILEGVAFISDKDVNGNFSIILNIKNNTKGAIDLKELSYRVIKKPNLIYRLEVPTVIYNEGIANSFILNPAQESCVYLTSPLKELCDLDIKEIYIKLDSKRIFFVPEDKIKEYSKLENRIIRHLRNLWWNIR